MTAHGGVTHYAGAITVPLTRGRVMVVDSGAAACCSGERARQIRDEMRNTYEPRKVTCKRCLRLMAKAERGATP